MKNTNRREFLKSSAVIAAGVSAAGTRVLGANERIRAAVAGIRGRGRSHIRCLHEMAGDSVELVALCDVDWSTLGKRSEEYEKKSGKKIQKCADLRKLLDDKSIDVICYGTPNHWHSLGTIWACQAGKDVYVEKPGSHNIFEGRQMVEAARKYKRIVQHGTQCRSAPNIREGIQKLKEGVIGRVYMARGIAYKLRGSIGRIKTQPAPKSLDWNRWQGPAPEKPFARIRYRGWHNLWDYGNGEIGNQGVHQFDMIRWGLGLDTHPNLIQSMGGSYVYDDDQQTPTIQTCSMQWDDSQALVTFEVRPGYTNSEAGMGIDYPFVDKRNVCGVIFFGTDGYMIIPDYSSYRTFLGPKRKPGPTKFDPSNPMSDLPHFQNFIKAVRSRKPSDLTAEAMEGHLSSALCHLSNIAYRTRRTLAFDPKAEKFKDAKLNAMLTRDYREPFVVPKEV